MLGYDQPLFLLAFDHRRPHLAQLFGVGDDLTPDESARIIDAKSVIFDGFMAALAAGAPADAAGILVDEQFGATVAREASSGTTSTATRRTTRVRSRACNASRSGSARTTTGSCSS